MAKIRVDSDRILQLRQSVNSQAQRLNLAQGRLNAVLNNLDMQIGSTDGIRSQLTLLQKGSSGECELLDGLSSILSQVANDFTNADQKVSKQAMDVNYLADKVIRNFALPAATLPLSLVAAKEISAKVDEAFGLKKQTEALPLNNEKPADLKNWVGDYLWSVIKKAGHVGSTVTVASNIYDLINGKGDARTVGKTVKNARKLIESLSKDIKNMGKAKRIMHPSTYSATWAKRIFGTTDYFKSVGKASVAKKVKTRWYNNFQKAGVKEISKVSWKILAVDGAFNALDNYNEWKSGEISAGRAVVETIAETAVDTAVDIVLTSAVAATVGSVGVALGATVAAPAVVVAAGTIALKSGLDAIAHWATGGEKDFTEAVSDMAIDAGKAIAKGVKKGAEAIGKGVSCIGKGIKAGWKKLFG